MRILVGAGQKLLEHVLCLLHPSEIAKCRQICKYAQVTIDNSVILQLHIELALDGYLLEYVPRSRTTPTASDLIGNVRARRKALDEMRPFSLRKVCQNDTMIYAYERCDGFWGRTGDRVDSAVYTSLHYDLLVPFSSQSENLTKSHHLDFPIRDFIFWPAGDLQVLLEMRDGWTTRRFHFRTFSTNKPHPLAGTPFLDVKKEECSVWYGQSFLIEENFFGIVHYDSIWRKPSGNGEVIIWDWMEGKVVLPFTYALDATFLSQECLLRLVADGGELGVALTCPSTGQTTHVLKLRQGIGLCGARFLRRSSYNTTFGYFGPQPQSYAQLCPTFPVTPDPSVDIMVLELQFMASTLLNGGALLVIAVNQLLVLYRNRLEETSSLKQSSLDAGILVPLIYDWEQWGLFITRQLPHGIKKGSLTCVFGSKVLTLAPAHVFENPSDVEDASQYSDTRLVLLDFNPRAISRSVHTGATGDSRGHVVLGHTSRWSPAGCRSITCITQPGLGFKATISRHQNMYEGVYLDGSTFICENEHSYDFFSFLPGDEGPDGAPISLQEL